MTDPRKKLDLAQKTIFYFFLLRVFAELEGEPLKSLEYVDALCLALQQDLCKMLDDTQ